MPDQKQTPDTQPQGRRHRPHTAPDEDEAQQQDQSRYSEQNLSEDQKRVTQVEDEEAEDDEDDRDGLGARPGS
jgi:hypothetical protein